MAMFTFNIEFDAAFSKFKLLAGRLDQRGTPELKKKNSGCLEKLNNYLQTHGQLKLPTKTLRSPCPLLRKRSRV